MDSICACGHGIGIHEEVHTHHESYEECSCPYGPDVGKCLAVEGCGCSSFEFGDE